MTDCSSIQGSTGSSSDAMSSRAGSKNSAASSGIGNNSRVRLIRMVRPNARRIVLGPEQSIGFGFTVRGGKEFKTGFFVSKVDKGSEADLRGLRVGDQIIRVNGYHVDDAVHKELIQYVSSQDRLTLKVRGIGMLPIKEKTLDPLTWHIVPRHAVATTLTTLDEQLTAIGKVVRVVLKVPLNTKLGLGICKGPVWKPGIYVQFIKDMSVAKGSGLQPGDQILSCNSIDFSDVLFSEAVAVMKSSNVLEMIIKTGAGLELFPGESSGYNSSASNSIAGDQSPCWTDQSTKRLSMVREEPSLNQTKQWVFDGNRNSLDRRKSVTGIPNAALNEAMLSRNTPPGTRTMVQFAETDSDHNLDINNENNRLSPMPCQIPPPMSTINSPNYTEALKYRKQQGVKNQPSPIMSGIQSNNIKIADICLVSRQIETKTVKVAVHQKENDENSNIYSTTYEQLPMAYHDHHQQQPHKNHCKYSSYNKQNNVNKCDEPIYGKILQHQHQRNQALSPISSSSSSELPHSYSPSLYSLSDKQNSNSVLSGAASKHLERSPSNTSSMISSDGSSLSNAISEELKKRKERLNLNQNHNSTKTVNFATTKEQQNQNQLQNKQIENIKAKGNENRHNALMDEFKATHNRMFRNGGSTDDKLLL